MRTWIIGLLMLACGCGSKKEAPPKNEFEAFERRWVRESDFIARRMREQGKDVPELPRTFPGVYIGPSGVYVNRKLVATLAELDVKHGEIVAAINDNVAVVRSLSLSPGATWALDEEPARVVVSALKLFADRGNGDLREESPPDHQRVVIDPEIPAKATDHIFIPHLYTAPPPGVPKDQPTLSVLVLKDVMWVGLSQLNEFQEIPHTPDGPDFMKLETTLRDHRASSFFNERSDIELAIEAGTGLEALTTVGILGKLGFIDITLLPRAKLSANPSL